MRFLLALVVAVLSFVVALFAAALLGAILPEKAANVAAPVAFVAVPVAAFILVYRAVPKSRRERRAEVQARQNAAIFRRLPEKAQQLARGGGGVWQTATWHVTGGNTPTIQVLENGAWTTVFQAQFHEGQPGQWVATKITRDYYWRPTSAIEKHRDAHTIHSTKLGGRAPEWQILVYRSGPWEDELDEQLRAAEDAALARDRDRMGLE